MNTNSDISKAEQNERVGTLILMIGCILWGISGTCGQFLFHQKGIQSGWLVMVRMIISGIILMGICAAMKNRNAILIWKNRKDAIRLLVFTFCGFLVSQYAYLTGIYYSNAGTTTVLQEVNPVLIVFILCITKHRIPSRKELLCVFLAIGGTFLVATKGDIHSLAISPQGLFWGLMSAVGVVLYSLTAGDLTVKYGSLPVVGYAMLIGGIVFALATQNYRIPVSYDMPMLAALFGVVILGTAVAYTFYIIGVTCCGPVKASMFSTLEPCSAAVCSFLFLNTKLTLYDIIGSVMILSIVFILNLSRKKTGAA